MDPADTDSLVQATVIRDGTELRILNLDYPTEDDRERGAIRNYDYIGPTKLPLADRPHAAPRGPASGVTAVH